MRGRLLLVVVAALLVAACGDVTSSELEEEAQRRGGGLGQSLPLEAIDAIEAATGEPLQFTGLNLSFEYAVFTVLVPGTEGDLDSYTYSTNGDLFEPTPLSGVGPPEELQLMTVDDIAFDELNDIIDDAIERAGFDGAFASNVHVSRASSDRTTITVTIDSPRHDATVTYLGNGDFLEATST